MAVANYESTYREFPPAIIADDNGEPMHSWRVLLLPFLDERYLYEQYDFSEPWDGPNNRKLWRHPPPHIWSCPSDGEKPSECTNYFALTGADSVWQGGVSVDDITDGVANTLLLVELKGLGVHWMEPRDVTIEELASGKFKSPHGPLFHVTFVDALTKSVAMERLTLDAIRAWSTVAGGETLPGVLGDE